MTTSVDMKQAVAGSTVHFRCGGSAVLSNVVDVGAYININFEGGMNGYSYLKDGISMRDFHVLDIIRIEPPQFKWEDCKHGMAFTNSIGQLIYFIANSVEKKDGYVFEYASTEESVSYVFSVYHNDLTDVTRAPEHDKVQP